MKKYISLTFFLFSVFPAYAQWDDGVLIEVQEVNIAKMKAGKMTGEEAVMKVIEQYTDTQYRFAIVSNNYLIKKKKKKYLDVGKKRFIVALAGYPALNNLLYAQIFFDQSFFFIALTKRESDMKRSNDVQITKMNYEKRNTVRRNNVRDTIQRNNIMPLGIDSIERYY
jgi:hypothetical protein